MSVWVTGCLPIMFGQCFGFSMGSSFSGFNMWYRAALIDSLAIGQHDGMMVISVALAIRPERLECVSLASSAVALDLDRQQDRGIAAMQAPRTGLA